MFFGGGGELSERIGISNFTNGKHTLFDKEYKQSKFYLEYVYLRFFLLSVILKNRFEFEMKQKMLRQ
jgi:hypothetical protein